MLVNGHQDDKSVIHIRVLKIYASKQKVSAIYHIQSLTNKKPSALSIKHTKWTANKENSSKKAKILVELILRLILCSF